MEGRQTLNLSIYVRIVVPELAPEVIGEIPFVDFFDIAQYRAPGISSESSNGIGHETFNLGNAGSTPVSDASRRSLVQIQPGNGNKYL